MINAFTMPLGGSLGAIYRTVRGLVYNVQTTPNCPSNHVDYKVMGALHSVTIYKYFRVEPIHG
jgi:hypothetical protein